MNKKTANQHLTSFQIILFSFIAAIAVGTLLLMLPIATRGEGGASFWDALFTATSAACVTGLVVQNTVTFWAPFGQVILLILIQIGGMGVITMGVLIMTLSGRKVGLMQRSTMSDALGAPQVGGIVRITRFIIRTTAFFEIIGAVILFPTFYRDFGLARGLWYAVWHSVSAFCNAGFDLLGGKEAFSSLMTYSSNPLVVITIACLIIIGGIGFYTWDDISGHRWHFKKYRLQTKVILVTSGLLIVVPMIFFYFSEMQHGAWVTESAGQKWLDAFFQSVTTRTAGFNTVDLTLMKESGIMIMIVLMIIGGSPGSTAGGLKTTTLAVLLATAKTVFTREKDVTFFNRRVTEDTVRTASALLSMYLLLALSGAVAISMIENLPIMTCLFETASAVGTVGVTLGITPSLSLASRIILIVLMYFGRVGGLTIIYAAVRQSKQFLSQLPPEKLTVG